MGKKTTMRVLRSLLLLAAMIVVGACAGPAATQAPAASSAGAPANNPTGAPALPSATPGATADVIFTDGVVLTMDSSNPSAQAVAIQGDRILAVGTSDAIMKLRGAATLVVELGGRALLPGMVDAHNHLGGSAKGDGEKFKQLQAEAIRGGITTTSEMYVDPTVLDQLKAFDQAGLMRMRWNTYLLYNTNCGDPVDPNWFKTYKQGQQISPHIRNQGAKVFADGGSCNVPAVSFEYPGGYGQGDLYMTQEQLTTAVEQIQAAGYQVAIHALGDRAVEQAQNAIASALAGAPNTYRHRIEHNAVLHDSLLPRYAQVGIVPVIFGAYPTCWRVNPSSQFKFAVPTNLGTWEWPWRALLDANPGLRPAWHSDAPTVSKPDVIAQLYGFVTRNQVADDGSVCQAPDWLKKGAITIDEALHIMTINSAYALFGDQEIGSLEAGKLADMIILSANPEAVQPEAIKDIQVLTTMIGGKVEYCAAGSESLCPSASAAAGPAPTSPPAAPGPRTLTASQSLPDHPAVDAMDGSVDTWWSSGSGPEQWIQIDLGRPTRVGSVRLVISQYPEGETDHQLWLGPSPDSLTMVQEFKGSTKDLETLEFKSATVLADVRYVKIVTTQSPSWVAWREIEITGP